MKLRGLGEGTFAPTVGTEVQQTKGSSRAAAPVAPGPVLGPVASTDLTGLPWKRGRSVIAADAATRGAQVAMEPVTQSTRKFAANVAPVRYHVAIPNPASGYLEVAATFPTYGKAAVDLAMPRWTPGSYVIRDYAKNVDDNVTATSDSGAALPVEKTGIDSWRVAAKGADEVTVRYRVFSRDGLDVADNWVDPGLALITGAATFMTTAGEINERRCDITIDAPTYAGDAVSSLPAPTDTKATFTAPNYDVLVDTPIVIGATNRREFVVDGITYVLATHGAGNVWDADRAVKDLKRIVEEAHRIMGPPPFKRYVFHNLLVGKGGGLEHMTSTVVLSSPWGTRDEAAYKRWLGVMTHEFVHTWNVKHARPMELGPFDYSRENITPSLWIAEGLTSYYEYQILRRCGFMRPLEMLALMSRVLESIEGGPAHTIQTLADSSRTTWVKFYKQNANTQNVGFSYYMKGGLVGMMLDCEIRKRTKSAKSLDDVMRLVNQRYSGEHGYTPEQWEATASEVAGADLSAWFDRAVRQARDLPIDEMLANAGLRFSEGKPSSQVDLGVETKVANDVLVVSRVLPGSAAAKAGIIEGDEIIGFNGYRIGVNDLDSHLARYKAGESGPMLVSRRNKLETLQVTFAAKPTRSWALELDPNATAEQVAVRKSWLGA